MAKITCNKQWLPVPKTRYLDRYLKKSYNASARTVLTLPVCTTYCPLWTCCQTRWIHLRTQL